MEERDQKVWNASNQSDITIPYSGTYILEEDTCVSLKVATKGYLRGKKTLKM